MKGSSVCDSGCFVGHLARVIAGMCCADGRYAKSAVEVIVLTYGNIGQAVTGVPETGRARHGDPVFEPSEVQRQVPVNDHTLNADSITYI